MSDRFLKDQREVADADAASKRRENRLLQLPTRMSVVLITINKKKVFGIVSESIVVVVMSSFYRYNNLN